MFQMIFKTSLYHIDRIFCNEYLWQNTALKMQSNFKCIFFSKIDQSLMTKVL